MSFGKNLNKSRYDIEVDHYLAFLSLSSDCKWIAAAGGEKLTILSAETLEIVEIKKFEKGVKLCLFTPDSRYLVYGAEIVYFAKAGSWERKHEFDVKKPTSSAVFSNDGKKLYLGTYDKYIHFFEMKGGEWTKLQHYKVKNRAKDMSVDPGHKWLVTADKDGGGLSMFSFSKFQSHTSTRQSEEEVIDPDIVEMVAEPEVGTVCFSSDGRFLAWGGSLNALLMNVDKPTDIEPLPVDPKRRKTRTMHFSSNSRFLAYGGASHDIRVIDAQTIQPMFYIKDFHDGVWGCMFAPGNHWMVSCSYSRKITVAQLFNRSGIKPIPCKGPYGSISLSRFGELITTLTCDGTELTVHDFRNCSFNPASDGEKREDIKKAKGALSVISDDASVIVWGAAEGNYIYKVSRQVQPDSPVQKVDVELIQKFDHDLTPHGIGISSDNQYIITDNENEVHITSVETGEILITQGMPLEVFAQAFSPGPEYFAVGYGSHIKVYKFSKTLDINDCTVKMEGHTGDNVNCISFSTDNEKVASSSEGLSVCVWEIQTGRQLLQLTHDETVDVCQFSIKRPRYLLTATTTGNISLFNVDLGRREWMKVAGSNFQGVSFAMIGGDDEDHEHIVIVYKLRVEYYSMHSILNLGPNVADFVESVHLDNDYTEYIGLRIPYLCCTRPIDVLKEQQNINRANSGMRAEPIDAGSSYKNAKAAFENFESLARQATMDGEASRPMGKTAVQRAIELDAEECLVRLLRACPGSSVACDGIPIREALTMGNKGMLNKVLMAACDDKLSYSAREVVTRYLTQIAEKAPQVLAVVLKARGIQEYEVPGYKYCHCDESVVQVSPNWGAGDLWKGQKYEEGVEKDGAISKVSLSRVLFPNMGSPDILSAIVESEELSLFESSPIAYVVSAMWKYHYRNRFFILFAFHFTTFLANLISAILSVQRREDSREAILVDVIPTVYLLAAGGYNICYEMYQAYLNFEPDFWNILDWCYYVSLVVTSSLNLTGNRVWELGAINVVLSCMEILFYMRGFSYTGFLVRMLQQVISDLQMFMLIVIVTIVAFGGAFYTLYSGDFYDKYSEYGGYTVWTYLLMNQIIWETAFYEDSESHGLATALICLFLLFTAIILLNFIIAILSDTFEKVSKNQKAEGLKERANIILELNTYLMPGEAAKVEEKFRWVHIMRPWDLEWAKDQPDQHHAWGNNKQTEHDVLELELKNLEETIHNQIKQIDEANGILDYFVRDLKEENDRKK